MQKAFLFLQRISFVLIIILIAGCVAKSDNLSEPVTPSIHTPSEDDKAAPNLPEPDLPNPSEPPHNVGQEDDSSDDEQAPELNSNDGTEGSPPANNDQNHLEISSADHKDNTDKPKNPPEQVQPAFNIANPAILGMKIGDSKDYTISQHGSPIETFVMDDPYEPITVHRYAHFMVGFDAHDQIEFIDITSNQIDPGLNGITLGKSIKEAMAVLGDPDVNTDYVVSYRSDKAILKLDVDPNTERINSIKLFTAY